ncbi:hypothetical protein GGI1_08613, partial [Acidithiobacillus sp. GGI-221]
HIGLYWPMQGEISPLPVMQQSHRRQQAFLSAGAGRALCAQPPLCAFSSAYGAAQ